MLKKLFAKLNGQWEGFLGIFGKFSKHQQAKIQKHLDLKLVANLAPRKIPTWRQLSQLSKFLNPAEKKLIVAAGIIALASGLTLLGEFVLSHRVAAPADGGEYTEGLIGAPIAINPLFAPLNQTDADIARLIYAGLFKYDRSLNLLPDLAEKFTLDKNGKIYTVTLKPNLVWQDNEPLTVDDVAFTLEAAQNPETKSPLLAGWQKVKFNKIDNLNFTLELESPFAPFPHLLTLGILPAHLWQEVAPANLKLSSNNLKPIGAGPFMFASLSKDSRGNLKSYSLKQNPNYHLKKPYLEQITFKFYPDVNTAMEALRNRQVLGLSYLPKDQKEKISQKSLNLASWRLSQYTALFLNQKNNLLLKSQPLRQALNLAVNRSQIITQVLKNEGVPAYGPFPPSSLGATQDFKTDQDLNKANVILDSDKWNKISREKFLEKREQELYNTWLEQQKAQNPDFFKKKKLTTEEQDGWNKKKADFVAQTKKDLEAGLSQTQTFFREKNNYGLGVTLTALNQPEFSKTASLLKEWWQELGIQVNVNLVDAGQIREIIRNRSYEILLYGVVTGTDPDPYPLWHSSQVVNPGLNLANYTNRGADELLEKARASSDKNERIKLYHQFQKLLASDIPAIFLYHSTYLYPIDRSVKGIDLHLLAQPADRFNDITNWYMRTKSGWK